MRTYVVGDIHGCANKLKKLLKLIEDFDQLIFVGDYIDRGPSSKEVLDIIMDFDKSDNVIALKGNHEDMCVYAHLGIDFFNWSFRNGGKETIKSFDGNIPENYLKWMKDLPEKFENDLGYFIHAGMMPGIPFEEQHRDDILWLREPFLSTDFKWNKVIYHGHTPVKEVDIKSNRVNVDTGCVYNNYKGFGFLSAYCIESGEVVKV